MISQISELHKYIFFRVEQILRMSRPRGGRRGFLCPATLLPLLMLALSINQMIVPSEAARCGSRILILLPNLLLIMPLSGHIPCPVSILREDFHVKNLLSYGHCPKVPRPPPTHQVMNILDHFYRNC